MNALLDAHSPDLEAAGRRILQGDSPGQLMPLFFEMLWRKQGRDAAGKPVEHTVDPDSLRVADAIVIQRGRPIQWYFSSVREKGVLLSKLRKNVTAESIVEHFLQKKHLSVSGICAQFIEQCPTQRRGVTSTFIPADKLQVWLSTLPASRSGILHRFVDPTLAPGSSFNWEVSCMWTPSALDAERVESTKDLGNRTIPAELRCNVFLPDVSVTKRLVCSRHMAMVDGCCRAIAEHVDAITGGRTRIAVLELQFKVGPSDSLILLYPKRMAFSTNDSGGQMELELPCTLAVKLPSETINSAALSKAGSLRRTPAGGRQGSQSMARESSVASFASDGSAGSFPAVGGGGREPSEHSSAVGSAAGAIADVEYCCVVCKRKPPQPKAVAASRATGAPKRAIMWVPLKHILLSLEVLAEEKKKAVAKAVRGANRQSAIRSVTMGMGGAVEEPVVPVHISMLFPDLSTREEVEEVQMRADEKYPVCVECANGLSDAIR